MSNSKFEIASDGNPFLAAGAKTLVAVLTATCSAPPEGGSVSLPIHMVYMIDTSGSMDHVTRITPAKKALCQALSKLRPCDMFSIIQGTEKANPIVKMSPASAENIQDAQSRVTDLAAQGGTCFSAWLREALVEFAKTPAGMMKQALKLSDGENDSSDSANFEAALSSCKQARITMDTMGLGSDASAEILKRIAFTLGGEPAAATDADLSAYFDKIMSRALSKTMSQVDLRITPMMLGTTVQKLEQVHPIRKIIAQAGGTADQALEKFVRPDGQYSFPTESWGEETRIYNIVIQTTDTKPASSTCWRIAKASMVFTETDNIARTTRETTLSENAIRAGWTDDVFESTRMNPTVAHWTGQAEKCQLIDEGLQAMRAGQEEEATTKLKRAAELADQTDDEGTARMIRTKLIKIDEEEGTTRLRKASKQDVLDADLNGSCRTATLRKKTAGTPSTASQS